MIIKKNDRLFSVSIAFIVPLMTTLAGTASNQAVFARQDTVTETNGNILHAADPESQWPARQNGSIDRLRQNDDIRVSSGDDIIWVDATEENGWLVTTSHTFPMVTGSSRLWNPETEQWEWHDLGFSLQISTDHIPFLIDPAAIPQDDYQDGIPSIYMGQSFSLEESASIADVVGPDFLTPVLSVSSYPAAGMLSSQVKFYEQDDQIAKTPVFIILYKPFADRGLVEYRDTKGVWRVPAMLSLIGSWSKDHDIFNGSLVFNITAHHDNWSGTLQDRIGPREGAESRFLYIWRTPRFDRPTLKTVHYTDWSVSDGEGKTTYTLGTGNEIIEPDGTARVPATALYAQYARPGQASPTEYIFPDLAKFMGTLNVTVVDPHGNPMQEGNVAFRGGMDLRNLSGIDSFDPVEDGQVEKFYPGAGYYQHQQLPPASETVDLTMTAYPRVELNWNTTQIIDNPKHLVDHRDVPLYISPEVYVEENFFANPYTELRDVSLEVFDVDAPDQVIASVPPTGYPAKYLPRHKALGRHRVYIRIKPSDMKGKRLGVRAVVPETDRGRESEPSRILGVVKDPLDERTFHEPKKQFRFDFVVIRVGEWEDERCIRGEPPYRQDLLNRQKTFLREVFPGIITFDVDYPMIASRSRFMTHNAHLRRIFRLLNRKQKLFSDADLLIGLFPPRFLGSQGLAQWGMLHMNWESLGAAHGAVFLDPWEARRHITAHEFLHTLGLKDVYPSNESRRDLRDGWRPISANGKSSSEAVINIENTTPWPSISYSYEFPVSEAIMYDRADFAWPTETEYNALLDYATQPASSTQGAGTPLSVQNHSGDMLLISGEIFKASPDDQREVLLDPVYQYHGEPHRGGDMNDNPFVVQLVAGNGAVLEQGFFSDPIDQHEGEAGYTSFLLILPDHPDKAAIEIGRHQDGTLTELWERYDYADSPPTVHLTGPTADVLSDEFEVTWEVTAGDGSELRYTLLSQRDEESGWRVIAMDKPHDGPASTYAHPLDAASFPAGDNYRFKVIVSDGLLTAESVSSASYTIEGYVQQPALEIDEPEIEVRVPPGTRHALAGVLLRNAGTEELNVQFVPESLPEWVAASAIRSPMVLYPGQEHMVHIPLILPDDEPGEDLEAVMTLRTNDPDNPAVNVSVDVIFDTAPVPGLLALEKSPVGISDGDWPLGTLVGVTAYAHGGRDDLNVTASIESTHGNFSETEIPMEACRQRQGAYLLFWDAGESDAGPGDYGVTISIEDPETGLERDVEGYDFSFILVEPVTPRLTIERSGNNQLRVSWPAAATEWSLQRNTQASENFNYADSWDVSREGDESVTYETVSPDLPMRFYRLRLNR